MEVHHHSSHTEGSHHPATRNKWTHYFWEFIMLFLAVFCGFLAEYQLEHKIEKDREKQFIRTLVEDLKSDTLQLAENMAVRYQRELMIDSLISRIMDPNFKAYSSDIYFYARTLTRPQYFFPNDRTLQQLKNSGGLRLIRNMAVSDSIMAYDQRLRYVLLIFEDDRKMRDDVREIAGRLLDGRVLYEMTEVGTTINIFHRPMGNPAFFSYDPLLLNRLISAAQYLKAVTGAIRHRQNDL